MEVFLFVFKMVKNENVADCHACDSASKNHHDGMLLFHITALKEKLAASFATVLALTRKLQKPSLRSQPNPVNNDGPVKVAVGENFRAIVTDSGRDAFIEFYSPSCTHCMELQPTWAQLGERLKNEAVDVIKIDATANEWSDPQYIVRGYPTIYWKFADKTKVPIEYINVGMYNELKTRLIEYPCTFCQLGMQNIYTKNRTLLEFIRFAAAHATSELKGWDRNGKPKKRKF